MSTTIQGMYVKRLKQYFGTAEIMVFARSNESRFFSPRIPHEFAPRIDYAVGSVQAQGRLKTVEEEAEITIHGFDFDTLQTMNPLSLVSEKALVPFSGKVAVIGLHTARKYGIELGDSLHVEIRNTVFRFRIGGIAESGGFLADDGRNDVMITPLSTLASIFDARGRVSMVYIKARNPDDAPALLADLQAAMTRHFVRHTVSREEIMKFAQDTAIPFRIMLVLTLAMSIFIIFTCFQVIVMERLPVIGTFRSIGASRRTTNGVLLGESLLYGAAGGVLGSILGIGVIYLMTQLNTGGWLSQNGVELHFTPMQIIQSFLLAVMLSVGSALVPILRVSRLPVKDVILNTVEHVKGRPRVRAVTGLAFMAAGIVTPFYVPVSVSLVVDSVCILLILTSVVMLVPLTTRFLAAVLQKAYRFSFGNIGILAAKNLTDNRSILHSIALLAIGISSLYMINTISGSVMSSLTNMYRDAKFDIQVWAWPPDKNLERSIRTVPGVSQTYGVYGIYDVELPDLDDSIDLVHGIDKELFGEYWDMPTTEDRETLFHMLYSDRYILPSFTLQKRLDLRRGDTLLLDFGRRRKEYEVAGFVNTLMMNGNYALVGDRFLKLDSGSIYYSDLYVKSSGSPDVVKAAIQEKLARKRPWIITKAEMETRDRSNNEELFLVLRGFSLMTLLVGVIGIFNNYLLSFIERRRALALLRSIGMSKKQGIAMLFLEALSGGIVGGLSGLGAGLLILIIVPHLFNAMRLPVIVFFSTSIGFLLLAAGMLISLTASVFPALKTLKLNIIETIRYE